MERLTYREYHNALKQLGISYLGKHSQSAKMQLSSKNGTITYCLYLAPWNISGHQVCPAGAYCHAHCLNASGRNRCDIATRGFEHSHINVSRIKKTRLFYDNRELFMAILIYEIEATRRYAIAHDMDFSIRLNGTSDLSPELFIDPLTGKNILQLFPDVPQYDYSKVFSRVNLMERYPNYTLVFSYDGHNIDKCLEWLNRGGNVAVVFADNSRLPKEFMGYPVCDGNLWDMRYLDPKQHVVGLHYHRTANDYVNGKYVEPDTDFVSKSTDERCVW